MAELLKRKEKVSCIWWYCTASMLRAASTNFESYICSVLCLLVQVEKIKESAAKSAAVVPEARSPVAEAAVPSE